MEDNEDFNGVAKDINQALAQDYDSVRASREGLNIKILSSPNAKMPELVNSKSKFFSITDFLG